MSLTKFTPHPDERHSQRHSWWVHIILLSRHLENTWCQLGSYPPPRECDLIKGKNAALQLMKSYLCHHFCFLLFLRWQNACSVCQTRTPGLPGQKGEKGSHGALGVEGLVGEKVRVTPQHGGPVGTEAVNMLMDHATLHYTCYISSWGCLLNTFRVCVLTPIFIVYVYI